MGVLVLILSLAAQDAPDAADGDIRRWIDGLGAEYEEGRAQARSALEKVGTRAENLLILSLRNDDFRVRRACLELLTQLKSSKAVPEAASLFKEDGEETVRSAAFQLLILLPSVAEEFLVEALSTDSDEYRAGALKALAEIKSVKAAAKAAELYDKNSNKEVKDLAFRCLKEAGPVAQPFFLKLLSSADFSVRMSAIEGLMGVRTEEAIQGVAKAFVAENAPEVIAKAFEFLRDLGDPAEPHFIRGLGSAQAAVRLRSIEGLRDLHSDKAIDGVAALFEKDPLDNVREAAFEFLIQFKDRKERVEPILLGALDSDHSKRRYQAIEGLAAIGSERPLDKIAEIFKSGKDKEAHQRTFDYLAALPKASEKYLIEALKDASPEIRRRACLALGSIQSENSITGMMELMDDPDPAVREAAVDGLVRIGPKALEAVSQAVARNRIKKAVSEQMRALYLQESVEAILDRQITDQGGTGWYPGQFKGFESLGREKAIPVLLKMVSETDYTFRVRRDAVSRWSDRMRELAIMVLGELGDTSVAASLKTLYEQSPSAYREDERAEIALALYRLGEKKILEIYLKANAEQADRNIETEERMPAYEGFLREAMVLNRAGLRDRAKTSYEKLIDRIDQNRQKDGELVAIQNTYAVALYNLACLESLENDAAAALAALRRAIEAGFKDRQWIERDGDLAPLREEAAYRELLSDETLFKP